MFFNKKAKSCLKEKNNVLETYNAEVARGILHSKGWQEKMLKLKKEADLKRN